MRALSFIAAAVLCLALPARAEQSWSFVVDAKDLKSGQLSVEMTLRGFAGRTKICADMRGAGKSVRDAKQGAVPLARDPESTDCFFAMAPDAGPLVLHYRLDLADLAEHHGDPDWASHVSEDYIFNDEAVLLRPDPLPDDGTIEIEFSLPPGISIAAPWRALDRSGTRFASSSRQYDAGSYVAMGKLKPFDSIESHGGKFEVVLLGGEHKVGDPALRAWVERAAHAVGDFYGGVPTGRALVYLVPIAGQTDPGVFGTTLHRAAPSAVLFFGAAAADKDFEGDWMATHELFHIGNPRLSSRVRWFNEGSATYYQDVLRARAAMQPAEKIWSDLYDGFHRFCDPEDGHSLADESEHLRERHNYTKVYWGGACLFFRADVLIRERSQGKKSLDDVLRALLADSLADALDESDLLEALDKAAGGKAISEQLNSTRAIPLEPIYQRLGIVPIAADKVKLDDSAPAAALRKAILSGR